MSGALEPIAVTATAIDVDSAEEIKLAAELYREAKDAAPEVIAARKAMQLHQATADLAFYTQIVNERTALIKQLTAELNDGKDANLAAISAIVG